MKTFKNYLILISLFISLLYQGTAFSFLHKLEDFAYPKFPYEEQISRDLIRIERERARESAEKDRIQKLKLKSDARKSGVLLANLVCNNDKPNTKECLSFRKYCKVIREAKSTIHNYKPHSAFEKCHKFEAQKTLLKQLNHELSEVQIKIDKIKTVPDEMVKYFNTLKIVTLKEQVKFEKMLNKFNGFMNFYRKVVNTRTKVRRNAVVHAIPTDIIDYFEKPETLIQYNEEQYLAKEMKVDFYINLSNDLRDVKRTLSKSNFVPQEITLYFNNIKELNKIDKVKFNEMKEVLSNHNNFINQSLVIAKIFICFVIVFITFNGYFVRKLKKLFSLKDIEDTEDINSRDKQGQTQLILAAQSGEIDVVKKLIAQGANPLQCNSKSLTASMVAHRNGYKKIELLLVKHEDEQRIKDKKKAMIAEEQRIKDQAKAKLDAQPLDINVYEVKYIDGTIEAKAIIKATSPSGAKETFITKYQNVPSEDILDISLYGKSNSNEKACPMCAETILLEAKRCKHCGFKFITKEYIPLQEFCKKEKIADFIIIKKLNSGEYNGKKEKGEWLVSTEHL